MSSSLFENDLKAKIVLFCGGLGFDGTFFEKCINNMVKATSLVKSYHGIIDMKCYDSDYNDFCGISANSIMPTSEPLIEFNKTIAEIVDLAKNNIGKSILVMTKLDSFIKGIKEGELEFKGYDSIDNQTNKLVKIIESIKNIDEEIEIILVGHSQGGLVNLKAATIIPNKIRDLISISTPYSTVYTAYLLEVLRILLSTKNDLYELLDEENPEEYKKRVGELADNSFFKKLKGAWNLLKHRPHLSVIIGVSAYLKDDISSVLPFLDLLVPFDGLVCAYEQANIEHADRYILHNENSEFYHPKENDINSISLINSFFFNKKNIKLPIIYHRNDLFRELLKALWDMIKGNSIDFKKNPISKAIEEAKEDKACSNLDYKHYYDMIANNYSHKNIVNQKETIGIILSIIAK